MEGYRVNLGSAELNKISIDCPECGKEAELEIGEAKNGMAEIVCVCRKNLFIKVTDINKLSYKKEDFNE